MSNALRLESAGTLPRAATAKQQSAPPRGPDTGVAPQSGESSTRSADLPNPRVHTDLALNRLVLEFFDSNGTLSNSIPSQKQLDAYRLAAFSGKSAAERSKP